MLQKQAMVKIINALPDYVEKVTFSQSKRKKDAINVCFSVDGEQINYVVSLLCLEQSYIDLPALLDFRLQRKKQNEREAYKRTLKESSAKNDI